MAWFLPTEPVAPSPSSRHQWGMTAHDTEGREAEPCWGAGLEAEQVLLTLVQCPAHLAVLPSRQPFSPDGEHHKEFCFLPETHDTFSACLTRCLRRAALRGARHNWLCRNHSCSFPQTLQWGAMGSSLPPHASHPAGAELHTVSCARGCFVGPWHAVPRRHRASAPQQTQCHAVQSMQGITQLHQR